MNGDIAEQASLKHYTPLSVFGASKQEMQEAGRGLHFREAERGTTQSKPHTPLLGRTLIGDLSLREAEQSRVNLALFFIKFVGS